MAATLKLTQLILGILNVAANRFEWTVVNETGELKLRRMTGQEIINVDGAGRVNFPQGADTNPTIAIATSSPATLTGSPARVPISKVLEDSDGIFAANRITPKRAGWYLANGKLASGVGWVPAFGAVLVAAVHKNGVNVDDSVVALSGNYVNASISATIFCNGTTDYIELFGYQTTGSDKTSDGGSLTVIYLGGAN